MHKKYILLIIVSLVFLFSFSYQICLVSAVFNKSNIDSWSENTDAYKSFEKLTDNDKNSAWGKATVEQKKNFLSKYSEYKGKKVDFTGFESKSLNWYGSQLYVQNKDKWVSFDFSSFRGTLKSVTYDEASKTMTYEFDKVFDDKSKVNNKIRIDDGFIDKDGFLTKFSKGGFLSKDSFVKIAVVTYGNGFLEYKDEAFIIPKGSTDRGVYIGNHYYTQSEKDDETIIKLGSKPADPIKLFNAKVLLKEKLDSESLSAVLYTGYGRDNGNPRFVNFFDGKKVPDKFNEPYVAIDLTTKTAVLNDNKANTKKDNYMQLDLYSNFKSISGTGSQAWVKNGEAMFDFHDNGIYFQEGTNKGTFEIDSIFNIANKDPNQHVFTYKKYKDNQYADYFDKDLTVVQSGMLVSETSGMYVHGRRGRIVGGQSETGFSDLKYDQEYLEGYFDGTEEERLAAIARDSNTVVSIHGTPSISLPGQYVATEMLSTIDYGGAEGALRAYEIEKAMYDKGDQKYKDSHPLSQTPQEALTKQLSSMGPLVAGYGGDLTKPDTIEKIAQTLISGKLSDDFDRTRAFLNYPGESIAALTSRETSLTQVLRAQNPSISDAEIRRAAIQAVNGYVITSNYNPAYDYNQVTDENKDKMPAVNRLLYELSVNYRGDIDIPDKASLRARPSSSGGISELQFRGDGVYVDGQKIPGVTPQVATAFRNTVASGLLEFEQTVADRQEAVQRYGTKLNDAGYAFDINDYQTQRHESTIYYSRIIGARQVGNQALESARGQVGEKESKYEYYTSKKRLP